MTQPHSHNEPVQQQPAPAPENSWTGYAAVKYGFIFLIVVAILWFLATQLDIFT